MVTCLGAAIGESLAPPNAFAWITRPREARQRLGTRRSRGCQRSARAAFAAARAPPDTVDGLGSSVRQQAHKQPPQITRGWLAASNQRADTETRERTETS